MFKKKPNIKNLAPLRSSDRRKVTDQIISDFRIDIPQEHASNEPEEGQAQASGIGALRSSLLPEGALSARFTTTVGQNLNTISGTVYVGGYQGDESRVLWIKQGERIFPTVYTLWRHPGIIPLLHTQGMVLDKMRGGADLMTPGLTFGPPFPAKATKGAVVAIADYENPSVPVVVGECEIDIASLATVKGSKGHAVKNLHWHKDDIWAWSQTNRPGTDPPEFLHGWFKDQDVRDEGVEATKKAVQSLEIERKEEEEEEEEDKVDGGVSLGATKNVHVDGIDLEDNEESSTVKKEWTTKEIDEAFRNAFLFAMHNAREVRKGEPHHGVDFPIAQSQFMSSYIQPYLPAFSSDDSTALQLKKTSWKNIKKFIKSLDKEVLLKSKERNGGEMVVMDVDFEDTKIANFIPYRLPKKDPGSSNAANIANAGADPIGSDDSIGQSIRRIQLLKPKERIAPIFTSSSADPRALYLPTELRPIITSYIESENLVSATNKRLISINPILANAVFDSSSTLDKEMLAKGTVPRDALMERIISSCCAPHYAILRNSETRESVRPKAGTPPSIKITLETRTGNKTATKLSGLEPYYVRPAALAEELQKICASSTSVNQLVGTSPKNPVMEIMVQGPQKDAVLKALEKRGIKKEWVEVIDKTKKKKK